MLRSFDRLMQVGFPFGILSWNIGFFLLKYLIWVWNYQVLLGLGIGGASFVFYNFPCHDFYG
jgi:hypothetical protein